MKCSKYRTEVIGRASDLKYEAHMRFLRAAYRFCFRLRTGTTSTGLVGMVPHRTEVGDFVVIIKGVCVPLVLRKVNGFDDRFQVVGQAYFYSFMNGEALQRLGPEFDTIFLA
jgi:hypothetical protein